MRGNTGVKLVNTSVVPTTDLFVSIFVLWIFFCFTLFKYEMKYFENLKLNMMLIRSKLAYMDRQLLFETATHL